MQNAKKFAGLTLLLIFPIFVIWFLKSFGENKFSIPVFHQDATALVSEYCTPEEGQHYIPPFILTDQEGEALTEKFMEDKITVVSFFNSHCLEDCQKLNDELLRLHGNFEEVPGVRVLSLSTDPATDAPTILKAYAEARGLTNPKWYFATGEKSTINKLIQCGFILPVAEQTLAVTAPENLQLVLVDGQRRIRGYYGSDRKEVDRLITEIKILLEE